MSAHRFDVGRHGLCAVRAFLRRTAVAMPLLAAWLDDQPCLGEDLDLGALIITHVSYTGGNFQPWQHVRASAVSAPFQGGRPSISPDDSFSAPESLDSYALKNFAL